MDGHDPKCANLRALPTMIKLRTNNMIERLNKEIRRRTRVVGSFPDSNSALMLVCARIRYVTSRSWLDRRYMDMSRLDDNLGAAA